MLRNGGVKETHKRHDYWAVVKPHVLSCLFWIRTNWLRVFSRALHFSADFILWVACSLEGEIKKLIHFLRAKATKHAIP